MKHTSYKRTRAGIIAGICREEACAANPVPAHQWLCLGVLEATPRYFGAASSTAPPSSPFTEER